LSHMQSVQGHFLPPSIGDILIAMPPDFGSVTKDSL
jgi:hypothetical protein